MDRLFGKELSNLLNPMPIATYSNVHKLPSKSTRDNSLAVKDPLPRKHEPRSTSVLAENKKQSSQASIDSS